jgi:serine/threonine protein kinase
MKIIDSPSVDLGSRYRVVQCLQRDAFGSVYHAEDGVLQRPVAVTVIDDPLAEVDAKAGRRERFRREMRIVAGIDHLNVAKIRDIIETPAGLPAVVADYRPGESLLERMKRGPLRVADAVMLASQIAAGMAAAHDAGLFLPELKPSAIHVSEDDEVVLFYLDVSARMTPGLLGTIVYMAPEQVAGRGVDRRTDVWNLGMVVYEMLTGRRAFGDGELGSRVRSILFEPVAPPSRFRADVPPALDAIVTRALDKNPDRRYPSAAAFLGDVRQAAAAL